MNRWLYILLSAGLVCFIWWVQLPHSDKIEDAKKDVKPEMAEAAIFPLMRSTNLPDAGGKRTALGNALGVAARFPLETVLPPVFRTTAQGNLLRDEQARIDMERVVALNSRSDAAALLASVTKDLGGAAQREVWALYEQMVSYEQSLSAALANEPAEPKIEDVRRQLQIIRALRAQHFGDNAKALFEEEAAQQLRLLNEAEKTMQSSGVSLEEAIGQAQAHLMAEVAAKRPK